MSAAAVFIAGGVPAQAPPSPIPSRSAPLPPLQSVPLPPPLPAAGDLPATAQAAATASSSAQEGYRGGTEEEPQVTTIRRDNETVEEVRVGGELRYVRVTPRHGRSYFLVPSGNGQTFNRMDSLGTGLSVPMWMLFSW